MEINKFSPAIAINYGGSVNVEFDEDVNSDSDINYDYIIYSKLDFYLRDGSTELVGGIPIVNNYAIIGMRMELDGSNFLSIPTMPDHGTAGLTLVCRFNMISATEANQFIYSDGVFGINGYYLFVGGDSLVIGTADASASAGTILDNTDYIVHATHDGTTLRIYLNGEFMSSTATGITQSTSTAYIGQSSNEADRLSGYVSKVAVFSEAKDAEWIKLDYIREVRF